MFLVNVHTKGITHCTPGELLSANAAMSKHGNAQEHGTRGGTRVSSPLPRRTAPGPGCCCSPAPPAGASGP